MGILAGLSGRSQRVLISPEAVVENRARPLNDGQPHSLASAHHLLAARLDQRGGAVLAALAGGKQHWAIRRRMAPGHLGDRLSLLDQRSRPREVSGE